MFDSLSRALQRALHAVTRHPTLDDASLDAGLRDVRRALLEADVPLDVLRPFLARVRARARRERRVEGVTPAQQVVAAVHHELAALLGPGDPRLPAGSPARPGVVLLLGLQGTGKTTTCGKLAHRLLEQGRRPLLVAADLQRPAAAEQLGVLGAALDVPVITVADVPRGRLARLFDRQPGPADVAALGIERARAQGCDAVIVDTAGRLHVDAALLDELRDVHARARPDQTLLVCDAMAGQDAINSVRRFHEAVGVDGVILSKTDGDARGGAALAIREVTGCPLRFLGTGERLEDLEPVRPEGLASRILGQGDVVRLVELTRRHTDPARTERAAERLARGQLDFEDFLAQLRATQRIGLRQVMKLLPGLSGLADAVEGDELRRVEAIICSMTPGERRNPHLLSGPRGGRRRRRIARGSGHRVQEVNRVIKNFKQAQRLLGAMARRPR